MIILSLSRLALHLPGVHDKDYADPEFLEQIYRYAIQCLRNDLSVLGDHYICWGSSQKRIRTDCRQEYTTLHLMRVYDQSAKDGLQKTHCIIFDFMCPYLSLPLFVVHDLIVQYLHHPDTPVGSLPESAFFDLPDPSLSRILISRFLVQWLPRLCSVHCSALQNGWRNLSDTCIADFGLQYMQHGHCQIIGFEPPTDFFSHFDIFGAY